MLDIWTVYDHPSDHPDCFVARKFVLDKPTDTLVKADTLEDVRRLLPQGLHRIARHVCDDPVIVESWL